MTTEGKGAAAPRPSVITLLEAARARIAKGWCQHAPSRGEAVCLVAATHLAREDVGATREDEGLADKLICDAIGIVYSTVVAADWNDAPGRTQADVLAAIDRAVAVERGTAPEWSP